MFILIVIFIVVCWNKSNNNFRIGLWVKLIPTFNKLFFKNIIIYDYTIMNNNKIAIIRYVRMRVSVVPNTVRCPTIMCNARMNITKIISFFTTMSTFLRIY